MKKVFLILISVSLFISSCEKEEDKLTPTTKPEEAYILPQGDNDFDKEIVALKEKYGTYFLYKFSDKDFSWGITNNYQGSEEKNENDEYIKSGYVYELAQENYIGEHLILIKDNFLNLYNDEFLKEYLPLKILLVSDLNFINSGANTKTQFNTFIGYDYIAINGANENISDISPEETKLFKTDLNSEFLLSLFKKNILKIPNSFIGVTNYQNSAINDSNYKEYGLLDPRHMTYESDFYDYIHLIVSKAKSSLQAEEGELNPSVDINGKISEKYEIVVNFFKDNFDIDLTKIAEDDKN